MLLLTLSSTVIAALAAEPAPTAYPVTFPAVVEPIDAETVRLRWRDTWQQLRWSDGAILASGPDPLGGFEPQGEAWMQHLGAPGGVWTVGPRWSAIWEAPGKEPVYIHLGDEAEPMMVGVVVTDAAGEPRLVVETNDRLLLVSKDGQLRRIGGAGAQGPAPVLGGFAWLDDKTLHIADPKAADRCKARLSNGPRGGAVGNPEAPWVGLWSAGGLEVWDARTCARIGEVPAVRLDAVGFRGDGLVVAHEGGGSERYALPSLTPLPPVPAPPAPAPAAPPAPVSPAP
jgi:hypothetical protein